MGEKKIEKRFWINEFWIQIESKQKLETNYKNSQKEGKKYEIKN